jgi:hypothetical protein
MYLQRDTFINIWSGSRADLANAPVVHLIDPGSNLGSYKICTDSICVRFEFKFVGYYSIVSFLLYNIILTNNVGYH